MSTPGEKKKKKAWEQPSSSPTPSYPVATDTHLYKLGDFSQVFSLGRKNLPRTVSTYEILRPWSEECAVLTQCSQGGWPVHTSQCALQVPIVCLVTDGNS